ncbi:MAG TPA: biotin/lipoyl-containing protein, partial [Mycobacterium sp.]|nr:biotin/lipoyl-containing protein [Mycobacterium sp.]
LHTFEVAGAHTAFSSLQHRTGIRCDSAVADGSVVSIHYDPMLAKVISYAPTRRRAVLVLADALARSRIHGLHTNRDLLVNVLRHPAFLDGATDTAFFDTHGLAGLAAPLADSRAVRLSAMAAALADAEHNRATATVFTDIPSGWRNLAAGNQVKTYLDGADGEHRVCYRFTRTGVLLPDDEAVTVISVTPRQVLLADADGVGRTFTVARPSSGAVFIDSPLGPVHLVAVPRLPEPGSEVEPGSLVAPMPGSVLRIGAAVGDTVSAGQPLVWLEAMKMEQTITAPADGVLAELHVEPATQVEVGTVLARIESPTTEGDGL